MCSGCDSEKEFEISAKLGHVIYLTNLQKSGFKIKSNTISMLEWNLITEFNNAIDELQKEKWQTKQNS